MLCCHIVQNIFYLYSLFRPLAPDDLGEWVAGCLAGELSVFLADWVGVVVQLLHPRLDDHAEVGGGLQAASVVLGNTSILALVTSA